MDNNNLKDNEKHAKIPVELELSNTELLKLGTAVAAVGILISGAGELIGYGILSGYNKLKTRYTKWKLKRTYNKMMKDPNVDNAVKKAIKETSLGQYIESL